MQLVKLMDILRLKLVEYHTCKPDVVHIYIVWLPVGENLTMTQLHENYRLYRMTVVPKSKLMKRPTRAGKHRNPEGSIHSNRKVASLAARSKPERKGGLDHRLFS